MKNLEAQRSQYLTLYGQQLNLLRFLMNVGADYPLDVERMPGDITPVQTFGVSDGLPELRLAEKQKNWPRNVSRQHARDTFRAYL